MQNISHLFDRFKNVAVKEIQKRTFVSEIIKKEIGQEIPIEDISFREGIIRIKSSSIVKNQIFIKKAVLLALISKKIEIVDIQ